MNAMTAFDKLLGPINPNKVASRTAADVQNAFVFEAHTEAGKSVASFLVKTGRFRVTAMFRKASEPVARELAAQQVTIHLGRLEDPRSYAGILEGMDCAYLDGNYLGHFKRTRSTTGATAAELAQTKAAVDACVQAKIKHLVYSALDDFAPDKDVPHCAAKAEVVRYIKANDIPATFIYTSHAYSDILKHDHLKPIHPGCWTLDFPVPDDCTLPAYAIEQTGEWVRVAMQRPDRWIGKDMHVAAEYCTPAQMARDIAKVTKQRVDPGKLTMEEFYSDEHKKKLGEAQWKSYRAYMEGLFVRDTTQAEAVVPHVWSFRQWATQSKELKQKMAS